MADRNPIDRQGDGSGREKYRHDNDARDPVEGEDRLATSSDTKSQAKGDARESIGNTAHKQYGNPDSENTNR